MRTWLEKILQTSLQMESKISIAQIINDMICVKVDKAPHSASSRRSQCPSARRPPTLRNSYITITSCTYHKIRSRASDLETSSSRTRSPLSHPLNPSSVTDADSATSTKCSIIHVNRSAQGRRRLMTMMTTSLRPRQGWTTFSSFIQKEAVPLSDRVISSAGAPFPSFIWYHSPQAWPWFTRPPPFPRPWARAPMREKKPRAPPCWIHPPSSHCRLRSKINSVNFMPPNSNLHKVKPKPVAMQERDIHYILVFLTSKLRLVLRSLHL